MCLQTVDHPTKYTDLTEGYKLVKKIGNRLIPEYYGNGTLKENIWIYNKKYKYPSVPNKILSRYGTDKYYLGFHCAYILCVFHSHIFLLS